MVSKEKPELILILAPLWVRCLFFWLLSIFSLGLWFSAVWICISGCKMFFWYMSYLVFSELPGSVVWSLSLFLKNSPRCYFTYCFCSFLSSASGIPTKHTIAPVVIAPLFSKILLLLFLFFCFVLFLAFQFGKFLLTHFKLTDSFFSYVQSTGEPIKGFMLSVGVYLNSSISCRSCLNIPSTYITHLFLHIVHFSIRALSVLITIILNTCSGNSNVCITLETGSVACFVSLHCVLSYLLACLMVFCWKPDNMYWIIEIEVNKPLVWGLIFFCWGVMLCSFSV